MKHKTFWICVTIIVALLLESYGAPKEIKLLAWLSVIMQTLNRVL